VALPGRAVLSLLSSDPGHVIAMYNPLILVCFTRAPKTEELSKIQALAALGITEGIRGGMLYVIARRNFDGGVDPRVRTFFQQMIRANSAKSGGSAAVVQMQGFAGSVVRSVLAGLVHLTSRRKLLQIFGSPDEACTWLAAQHDLDAAALLGAYEQATAHLA
jgi:hypothetical protein